MVTSVLDLKGIETECEKILREQKRNVNDADLRELRKVLVRRGVFKVVTKQVVEYYYGQNIIPLESKNN